MDARLEANDAPAKDPYLPPLVRIGDVIAPRAPRDLAGAGLDEAELVDLVAKLALTVPRFSTEGVCKRLHLSLPLTLELLELVCREGLIEETMRTNEANAHYKITQRGREYATRSMEVCAYIGPAPVRLEAYSAMLRWQFASTPQVKPETVATSLSKLVLSPEAAEMAGLAVSSGRSMFVFGPPGNGKSSLGRQIHAALPGDYWIPHCLSVANSIIRIYDDQCHERVEIPGEPPGAIDPRWVRIRRPLVIVGGELTLEYLDIVYSPALRYYEAPPHLKSNGGVFLVDDFGRERMEPQQLLNRFITPMEYQIDYFTLRTGQKFQVPLRHVLIIATNLTPEKVTDPAFLRRFGYRVYMGAPSQEQYIRIFRTYAERLGVTAPPEVIERLLKRYRKQGRELRGCEPRDLIERARDICRYHGRPLELTNKVLDLAWIGYFGNEPGKKGGKVESEPEGAAEVPDGGKTERETA
jgi:MoxR-like ATPase